METEQAHSSRIYSGNEAALRRPRTPDRGDFAPQYLRTTERAAPAKGGPAVWLNLVCLDAPLVSVAWLWLFARTFHAAVDPVGGAALFLTAWLIYLADRLADSSSLPDNGPRSLRHEFCLKHRRVWIGVLAVVAAVDAVLAWNSIGAQTLRAGAVVGTLALIHLMLNYWLGGAWPPLPLKEVAIGTLFAAGTLVPLFPVLATITALLVFSTIAFAWLCAMNCISIAFWERELDEKQRKISFATRYPGLDRHLRVLSIALALGSGVAALVYREAAAILGCVSVSSLSLMLLDSFRERVGRDQRTALADLVLLTPLLAFLLMNA